VALAVRPTDYPLRLVQQHNVRLEFKTSKPSDRYTSTAYTFGFGLSIMST
jgi:hypothetical protein